MRDSRGGTTNWKCLRSVPDLCNVGMLQVPLGTLHPCWKRDLRRLRAIAHAMASDQRQSDSFDQRSGHHTAEGWLKMVVGSHVLDGSVSVAGNVLARFRVMALRG